MLALSIRQPHAEMILRGIKKIEYRSRPTRVVGRRFWIYAAGTWPPTPAARRDIDRAVRIWSRDLAMPEIRGQRSQVEGQAEEGARSGGPQSAPFVPSCLPAFVPSRDGDGPPEWMLGLLAQIMKRDLPTGVIVGSALIEKVSRGDDGLWRWHLGEVRRSRQPRRPRNHPQPTWFEPFREAA